ncbi:hypothetical protein PMI06_008926 [Burkholderia sp. BT03]|nr:hypothetical protein PMI06_008926 [Burkholderia sp. BT03]SKC54452.1 hypothetical protein SAMN06266956_0677 [Paraburkholderia hospita]
MSVRQRVHTTSVYGDHHRRCQVDLHIVSKEQVGFERGSFPLAVRDLAGLHKLPGETGGHQAQFESHCPVGVMIPATKPDPCAFDEMVGRKR